MGTSLSTHLHLLFKLFLRHEKTIHGGDEPMHEAEAKELSSFNQDYMFNYHQAKLAFGLIPFEMGDCIKEEDSERLFEIYKLALLLYKSTGHTKYSYAVLLYLAKINFILPDNEAFTLKWNRFYNHHGGKGKNIPLDLRKEQLNCILKKMWRSLGANLNERSASHISESLEVQEMLITSIDQDCEHRERKGYRSNPKKDEAVLQIVSDLTDKSAFTFTAGREGYPSLPKFEANIVNLDYRDLHKWIKEHLQMWRSVYKVDG